MTTTAATLAIKIIADTANASTGLSTTAGKAGKLQGALSKMVAPAAVALGAVVAFGAGAVQAASRTEQAMGGIDAVFEENASTVKQWAADAASSIGLSEAAYGELATVIGSQLKNAGFSMDEVTAKTGDLIEKGADLAAMYGGTTAEAVQALSSALKGETDPIERYGASITEAAVQAELAAQGWDKLTGAAGTQAKAQARLNIITKQTADAEGAAAREHDSAAASAQQLSAEYENLQADLGEQLLPLMVALARALSGVVAWTSRHTTATKVIVGVVALLAVSILALNVALGVYTAVTTLAASATVAAWVAALWPILLVAAAIAAVVVIVVLLWKKNEGFRSAVMTTWNAIRTAASVAGNTIRTAVIGAVRRAITAFRMFAGAGRSVMLAIRTAVGFVIDKVGALITKIRSIKVPGAIRSAFESVRSAVVLVVSKVGTLIGKFKNISVPGTIKTAVESVGSAVDKVVGFVEDLIQAIKDIPVPSIDWPSPPGWLSKITGRSVAPPTVARAGVAGAYGAPRVPMLGARAAGSGGGLTVINVTGALDPENVARQIAAVQRGHRRRVGLRSV